MIELALLSGVYAVSKLRPDAAIPEWATGSSFCSTTRTPHELSIVCDEGRVPADVTMQGGWRALMVKGPLDFELTGVLASLATPLAAAGISVFAIATYETDYILIRDRDLHRAVVALRDAGHTVSAVDT